jgi:hypothetical protein
VGHRTLFDPREAGGSFTESGITIDVREVDTQRVTVPRSDTVSWYGTVEAPSVPRDVSGSVEIDLPKPFGTLTIDSWSSTGSSEVEKQGEDSYDLGNWVPGGAQVRVHGQHLENGTVLCTGQVFLQVEGSPFDSPIAPAALILTAATAAGFTGTFWSLFRGRP